MMPPVFGVPASKRHGALPSGAFRQADGGDHRSAPFPRRHRLQNVLFDVEYADPGGAIQLVRGEGVKIAVQRLNINRMVHDRLRAVHQHLRAMLMG